MIVKKIIPSINDDREMMVWQDFGQAISQLGPTDTPRQRDNPPSVPFSGKLC
jgi:hypothetical protein